MPSPRKRIGELLIAAGVIDPLDLQAALAHQRQWGGQLGATLIDRGFISEKTLVETLSQQLGLPIVKLSETAIDPRALPLVPARLCEHLRVFPIRLEEGSNNTEILILAMVDPTDLAAVDQIKFHSGHKVSPLLAADQDIGNAVRRWYHGRDPLQSQPPGQAAGLDPFTDLSIASPRVGGPGSISREATPLSLAPADLEEIDIDVDENEFSRPPQPAASAPPIEAAAAGEEEVDAFAEGWLTPAEEPADATANVLPAGEETFEAPAEAGWDAPVEMQQSATADWNAAPPDFGGSTADWEAPEASGPATVVHDWDAPLAGHAAEQAGETEWEAPAEEAEESGDPITIAPPSAAQWAVAVSQDVEQSWDAPPPAAALAETELPTVRIALSAKGSSWSEAPKRFDAPLATNSSGELDEEAEEAPPIEEPLSASTAWATAPPPNRAEQQPTFTEEPFIEEPLVEEPVSAAAVWATAIPESTPEPGTIVAAITDQPSYSFSGPATDWALGIATEESLLTVSESESQRWSIAPRPVAVPAIEETPSPPTVFVDVPREQPGEWKPAEPKLVEAVPEAVEVVSDVDTMMAFDSSDLSGGFDDPIEPAPEPEPEHPASEAAPELAPAPEPIDIDLGEFTRAVGPPPVEPTLFDEPPTPEAVPEAEPEELTHATETAPVETAHLDEHPSFPVVPAEEAVEFTPPTEAISIAPVHVDEPPAIPEAEPEELTHIVEIAAIEAAHLEQQPAAPATPEAEEVEFTPQTEAISIAPVHADEPPAIPEAEPISIAPAEMVPIEAVPVSSPPGFTPSPLSARPTEPLEITPPARITFPPGQGLVIESPVVTAPLASRQGWTLLGIENPTPSDAVDVMGALVNLLVGRGTVSTGELTEAIRKLREPSE